VQVCMKKPLDRRESLSVATLIAESGNVLCSISIC
jgi:hypothetical protein